MNSAQQMELAARLADALEQSGILVERAAMARGNVKAWERIDSGALAARTIGIWLSWGFSATLGPSAEPSRPISTPTSTDPSQRRLLLVPREEDSYLSTNGERQPPEKLNNDDEDDGA